MSTATTARPAPAPAPTASSSVHLGPWRVLRSEWIKLWSLRSTYWTLGLTIAVQVLLAWAVAGAFGVAEGGPGDGGGSAVLAYVTLVPGQMFGSLVVVVLAALTVTGEYGTGQVRSTFAAVPTRLPVMAAKAVVVGLVTFLTAAVGTALALLLAGAVQPALRPDWSEPEVLRIVLGSPLYVATVALLGFAVGALVRNTAAAIAGTIGFVLVVENILNLISWKPLEYVRPLLPASAGARVATPESMLHPGEGLATAVVDLSPWGGYAVLVGWVAVLLVAAAVRLRTRDV